MSGLEYLGKAICHPISINGYLAPRIDATETPDGRECHIRFDGRFGVVVPAEYAHQVLWLLANAYAVGAGFSCHGENSQPVNEHKLRVVELGDTP
jgi:hypothetical protein